MPDNKELTLDELKELVKEKDGLLEIANQSLSDSLEVIDELKEQLEAAKHGQTIPTVTLGEDTYQVTSPDGFRFKGKAITLDDLRKDEDLVQSLVDAGAGVLVKVEKPDKKKK